MQVKIVTTLFHFVCLSFELIQTAVISHIKQANYLHLLVLIKSFFINLENISCSLWNFKN